MKVKKVSKILSIILIYNILITPIQIKADKALWMVFGLCIIQLFNSLSQNTSSIMTRMSVDRLSANTIVNSTCSLNPAVSQHSFHDLHNTSNATLNSSFVGMGLSFMCLAIFWIKYMQMLRNEQRDRVNQLVTMDEMRENHFPAPERSSENHDRKDGYIPPAYQP